MRVASLHPGVTLDDVRAATGFEVLVDRRRPRRPPRLPTPGTSRCCATRSTRRRSGCASSPDAAGRRVAHADVVVLGTGAAGLVAALSARCAGAEVVLLE